MTISKKRLFRCSKTALLFVTGRLFAVKNKILSDKECEITICEGKYHQIKRMFCAVGNEVTNLRRIKWDDSSSMKG